MTILPKVLELVVSKMTPLRDKILVLLACYIHTIPHPYLYKGLFGLPVVMII
jgi:hypothetical protein